MAAILAVMACAAIWVSWVSGSDVMVFGPGRGFALPSPAAWLFGHPAGSLAVNVTLLGACAALMAVVNSSYNIVRSFSLTFVGLFLLMTAASPSAAARFTGGTLLAAAALLGMLLMYSVYNRPKHSSRRVFLVFLMFSALGLTQYGALVYIPVFFMGIGQMRVLNMRTSLAALLGTVTPLWLWWAFWPGEFPLLHAPQLDNPFATLSLNERLHFFAAVAVTLFTGLIMGSFNLVRIFSYNAKARALNGLLTVTGVITGLAALVDWSNMTFYIPLLNVCVAFQAGHFFHICMRNRWGYASVLVLVAVYSGLWVWSLL